MNVDKVKLQYPAAIDVKSATQTAHRLTRLRFVVVSVDIRRITAYGQAVQIYILLFD